MNVLDEIVAKKRLEIEKAKAARPLETLQKEAASFDPKRRAFRKLFDRGSVLIAEIKPKSPSEGELITGSPLDVADLYAKSSADVISVLTDKPYFGGDIELLKQVKACVPQAILRKDFIVDEYQVYETFLSGADAFLLIANILKVDELIHLIALGKRFHLDTLLEVHSQIEVAKVIAAGAEVIGINNRDLQTLQVDLKVTETLAPLITKKIPMISESGIESAEDVRRVRKAGARGILVGTSILKSSDPLSKIHELKQALAHHGQ
jgi:indole-3-glycerol phosphate synthase